MTRLSFKEYYESKKRLLMASESIPRIRNEYYLTKYCKFPIFESMDSDSKQYVSFKPKDRIEVLWEKMDENDAYPAARRMLIISESGDEMEVYPCWNNKKMHNWIDNNTNEI